MPPAASSPARYLLFYPHFWGARAPRLNPQARAVLFGLSDRHRAGHVWRAILEGVAYQHRGMVQSLQELGFNQLASRWSEAKLGVPCGTRSKPMCLALSWQYPSRTEASALGSAILAELLLGAYRDVPDGITRTYRERERIAAGLVQ